MDLTIRKATKEDYQIIQDVEDLSFGVHIIPEEAKLIIEEGFGEIYIAFDSEKPVAYHAILFKEYNQEIESFLQPILRERKDNGEKVMHDDVSFDEDKYVYFHLLGVIPEYQGKGIGKKLLGYAKASVGERFPDKYLKACIRINNLPSIKACMRELKMYMEGIKPNNWDIIGSVETNFSAIGKPSNKPVLELKDFCEYKVVGVDDSYEEMDGFLIPVEFGEEDALIDGRFKK